MTYQGGRMQRFFWMMKNTKIFQSGFIVMDNLPKWKMKDFQSDEKYKGFSKWFYCNGQPVQEEKAKIFQNGKNCEDFSKW